MDPTLDYLDIPSSATLLHSSKFQPAPKITTNLPSPSPPSSAPTSPIVDSIPQFILAAAFPPSIFPTSPPTTPSTSAFSTGVASASASSTSAAPSAPPPPVQPHSPPRNSSKSNYYRPAPLLSSKDPLSLPTISNHFRRFLACVGPAFWFQDRVEEIVLWKRGWKWTTLWILLYGGLCRFPQLILCIPHITLIAVILSTYPYTNAHAHDARLSQSQSGSLSQSASSARQRLRSSSQTHDLPPPPTAASTSLSSTPYQANLQAIQNLMGTFSDLMDFVKPHVGHLVLNPASFSAFSHSRSASSSSSSTSSSSTSTSTTQSSPYTIHGLTLLIITFPPLLVLVSLPSFPLRFAIFIAGAGPIFALHPWAINELFPTLVFVAIWAWNKPIPGSIIHAYTRVVRLARRISMLKFTKFIRREIEKLQTFNDEDVKILDKSPSHTALKSLFERLIDNDRLSDKCWISEMHQVELWENERYTGPLSAVETLPPTAAGPGVQGLSTKPSISSLASLGSFGTFKSLGSMGSIGTRKGMWSKTNLRSTDRAGWTRRRDGWNGVHSANPTADGQEKQDIQEEYDGVDSRLTFPLAPGWLFVDSEDWRLDVSAEWADGGTAAGVVDEDGWVYTNDVWMDGPPPYVTRRRRWVRRVWFDPDKARQYRVLSSSVIS